MIEILVVIGIIIVLLGIAAAAFNALSGSRSIESGYNVTAAVLGRARTLAINDNAYVGVMFTYDPTSDRTNLYIVARSAGGAAAVTDDPDPLDRYKSFQKGGAIAPGLNYSNTPFRDRVIAFTSDTTEPGVTGGNRSLVKVYRRNANPVVPPGGLAMMAPPLSGPPFVNGDWEQALPGNLEVVGGVDYQSLPPGVGAQLVTDPRGGTSTDRYVRTGLIMFDPQGRVDNVDYTVSPASSLGKAMFLTNSLGLVPKLHSSYGVTVYDSTVFRAQGYTEGDSAFAVPGLTNSPYSPDELNEEKWLDDNTSPVLVNRNTGALERRE